MGSGRVHKFCIEELYITLATTNTREKEQGLPDNDRLMGGENHVPLHHVLLHQHVTIIGDPGSEKTTFLQYIASLLGKADTEQQELLLTDKIIDSPEWKEVLRFSSDS